MKLLGQAEDTRESKRINCGQLFHRLSPCGAPTPKPGRIPNDAMLAEANAKCALMVTRIQSAPWYTARCEQENFRRQDPVSLAFATLFIVQEVPFQFLVFLEESRDLRKSATMQHINLFQEDDLGHTSRPCRGGQQMSRLFEATQPSCSTSSGTHRFSHSHEGDAQARGRAAQIAEEAEVEGAPERHVGRENALQSPLPPHVLRSRPRSLEPKGVRTGSSRQISPREWEAHKGQIHEFYIASDLTLDEVKHTLEVQHGFFAT